MNFNEKLIKLRKEKGLSQEELGYKLNVTTQTVSKWELGQTTPEMDKLVEISKFFNTDVDSLINEKVEDNTDEIINDRKSINSYKDNRALWIIAIILLIGLLIGIVVGVNKLIEKKKAQEMAEGIFNKTLEFSDKTTGEIINKQAGIMGDILNNNDNTAIVVNNIEENSATESEQKTTTETKNSSYTTTEIQESTKKKAEETQESAQQIIEQAQEKAKEIVTQEQIDSLQQKAQEMQSKINLQ